ncbi:hypothetical protein Tco_0558887 [Tanacetum coccineum]
MGLHGSITKEWSESHHINEDYVNLEMLSKNWWNTIDSEYPMVHGAIRHSTLSAIILRETSFKRKNVSLKSTVTDDSDYEVVWHGEDSNLDSNEERVA